LDEMRLLAESHFQSSTDLATVLWQNGLLGFVDDGGHPRYFSIGDLEDFALPTDATEYVFHPCLVQSTGLRSRNV